MLRWQVAVCWNPFSLRHSNEPWHAGVESRIIPPIVSALCQYNLRFSLDFGLCLYVVLGTDFPIPAGDHDLHRVSSAIGSRKVILLRW